MVWAFVSCLVCSWGTLGVSRTKLPVLPVLPTFLNSDCTCVVYLPTSRLCAKPLFTPQHELHYCYNSQLSGGWPDQRYWLMVTQGVSYYDIKVSKEECFQKAPKLYLAAQSKIPNSVPCVSTIQHWAEKTCHLCSYKIFLDGFEFLVIL